MAMRGHGYASMVVPAVSGEVLTPSSDGDVVLETPCRALWVGEGGTLVGILATDTEEITLLNVQSGELLPMAFKQISAETTCDHLVALR